MATTLSVASSSSRSTSTSRRRNTTCPTVQLQVGNTYRRLPEDQAPFDRSGTIRKVHDWTLYVDVVDNNNHGSNSNSNSSNDHMSDWIESVSFDLGSSFVPSRFLCHSPIPVSKSDDGTKKVMRFYTRQQTYGAVTATIKIRGIGGSTRVVEYPIALNNNGHPMAVTFTESNAVIRPLKSPKMPTHVKFGIELELTSATTLSLETIATALSNRRTGTVQVMHSHRQGREQTDCWKLVPDASIFCSVSLPDCNTFELVSPILQNGGDGLNRVSSILQSLHSSFGNQIKVNKSMGFHVHIDVSHYSVPQLVKICQNFIKYEDVMDTFMPLSRRTGSAESNRYFCSNKSSVDGGEMVLSNRQRHAALAACSDSVQSLAQVMNRGNSRYYKLNLQNLVTGRQPTLEFRQHSATTNYEKIAAWIRFCTALVVNSAKLATPKPFAGRRSIEYQLDALFLYVIKDRALAKFYRNRRGNLKQDDDEQEEQEHCCSGCARGSGCSRVKY